MSFQLAAKKVLPSDIHNAIPTMEQTKYNPFVGLDPSTNLSLWQKFTDGLGWTNHQGQLAYQQALASNQWESEYGLKQEDLKYNSPLEQAQRMRDAGLNPDLLGMENYEGQVSGNSMNTPEASNGINSALDRSSTSVTSVIGAAFDALKTYIAFKNGMLDLDSKEIENAIGLENATETIGSHILGQTDFPEIPKDKGYIMPSIKFASPFQSKKFSKYYDAWMFRNYGSLKHKEARYGLRGDAAANRNTALVEEGNYFTADKDDTSATKMLMNVQKFSYESWKLQTEFENKLAKYNIADLSDKERLKLYESNNEVQKICNDFKKRTNQLVNNFMTNFIHERGIMSFLMQYQLMSGMTGSTDMVALGAKGLGALGAVGLNAALRGKSSNPSQIRPIQPTVFNQGNGSWLSY